MASPTPLLLLLLLSLLHITTSTSTVTPPRAILDAAKTLYNSGYSSMSFTLHLLLSDSSLPLTTTFHGGATTTTGTPSTTTTTRRGPTHGGAATGAAIQSHQTLTIFAPPDSAFETSGQPPRTQLLLHFSPLPLSLKFLSSLPYATIIPTLSTASLVITTPPRGPLSINNVAVLGPPLYDDGSVIVFAIGGFFDSNFSIHGVEKIQKRRPRRCSDISPLSMLFDAASRLKSRGYSIMASFLELQLMGYLKSSPLPLKLTMFAPDDEVLLRFSGGILGYSGLFMRHLLPCKLTFADIIGVKNGTVIKKNFDGLGTMIEVNDGDFFVNGVRITFPDLYVSDSLVIHGIGDAISQQLDGSDEEEEMEVEVEHSESSAHWVEGFGPVSFPAPPEEKEEDQHSKSSAHRVEGFAPVAFPAPPDEKEEDEHSESSARRVEGFGRVAFPVPPDEKEEDKHSESNAHRVEGFGPVAFPAPPDENEKDKHSESNAHRVEGFGPAAFPAPPDEKEEDKDSESNAHRVERLAPVAFPVPPDEEAASEPDADARY